jgi:predicted Fe-S protein YdhL (DUF1289 family)
MKSPCKGVCVLDKERIRCIGCNRTIDEKSCLLLKRTLVRGL